MKSKTKTPGKLTIEVRHVGGWLAATVKERPEIHTQGRTLPEVLENVADACYQVDEARRLMPAGKARA
jgi:predicted RNase H-like HicB family nuclease